MEDSAHNEILPWTLPERYTEMPSRDQQEVLKGAILAYLRAMGYAARSQVLQAIKPPRTDTFQKALDFLSTTQQIYADLTTGSRDPTYFSNGRLAHPTAQKSISCGRHKYVIRAYDDRIAGKTITITQYAVLPSAEDKPISGIRIDWQDGHSLIEALSEVVDGLERGRLITKDSNVEK